MTPFACCRVHLLTFCCVLLLPGCVLDVVLVSLMAPRAVLGGKAAAMGASALQKWLAGIPSAALEASIKGEATVQRCSCSTAALGVAVMQHLGNLNL
jgi:hypothetical protein